MQVKAALLVSAAETDRDGPHRSIKHLDMRVFWRSFCGKGQYKVIGYYKCGHALVDGGPLITVTNKYLYQKKYRCCNIMNVVAFIRALDYPYNRWIGTSGGTSSPSSA